MSFLTTRVNVCNEFDLDKLHWIYSYLNSTRERGIILRIGSDGPQGPKGAMMVHGLIDVAYGVHGDHKSHTGCVLRIRDQAVVYFRSAKQKIISKSSTEGELVGLSDSANVAIHYADFIRV